MSQIFLFTGENYYELSKERNRWIQEFITKHGQENLVVTDSSRLSMSIFMDEICTAPFIAQRRMVLVDGIPKLEKDQYALLESSIHPQVLLVFVDPKPDKRLSFTKEVLAKATVKTFTPLRGAALQRWISDLTTSEGSSISTEEILFLLEMVGENQSLLANEICKLTTLADGKPITKDHIESMVILSVEQAGWKLMDLLAAKNRIAALQFVQKIQVRGESPYALWTMFLWIVSQLGLVAAAVADGMTNPQDIAKHCGISPMTARNLAKLARGYNKKQILNIITIVTDADIALKTGGYRFTADAPEELAAVIDNSIAAVTA